MHKFWLACFILSILVVGLGVLTRLYDAGLSCPDWPLCYGKLHIVLNQSEIESINRANSDTPYDIFRVSLEYIHRYLATLLGFMALAMVFYRAAKKFPIKIAPIVFLILVSVQGIFGALTVTQKLDPLIVTIHLLLGFSTVLFCFWSYLMSRLDGSENNHYVYPPPTVRHLLYITTVFLILQIALGGWTSSSGAALACGGYPSCGKSIVPELSFDTTLPAYLQTIHFLHRWWALVFTILLGMTLYILEKWGRVQHISSSGLKIEPPTNYRWILFNQASKLLIVLVGLQWALGILNILYFRPVAISFFHNLNGLALLLTFAFLLFISDKRYNHNWT